MDLLSCCVGGRRRQERREQEKRHARIVAIYAQAQAQAENEEAGSHGTTLQAAPPAYHEVVYDVDTGATVVVDTKETQSIDHARSEPPSRPASPQTSIFSVPSTRLTDITSSRIEGTNTGANTYRGDSPRSSLAFDSAPPSYHDGRSLRERSPSPSPSRRETSTTTSTHPVTNLGWLNMFSSGLYGEKESQ